MSEIYERDVDGELEIKIDGSLYGLDSVRGLLNQITSLQAQNAELNEKCEQAFHDLGINVRRAETAEADNTALRERVEELEKAKDFCHWSADCDKEGCALDGVDCPVYTPTPEEG